jgi:zinc transporter
VADALDIPAGLRPGDSGRERSERGGPVRRGLQRQQGWIRLPIVAVQAPGTGEPEGRAIERVTIDVLAGENVVVTVHEVPADPVEALADQLRDEPGLGALDAAALVAALVDAVLALYLRHAESIERRIDDLDEIAIRGSTGDAYLGEVVVLRRRVASLRRALAPHRETFGPLARPDFEIAAPGRPWPGLVDRLETTIGAIQTVHELLVGSVELRQSSAAQRANDVMKRLTILNAVLLPSVVLAGTMGMNFRLGFFEVPSNFWLVVTAMAILAVGTLGLARLRGWL